MKEPDMGESMGDPKRSKFHGALKTIERIDSILSALNYSTIQRRIEKNSNKLMMVWSTNFGSLEAFYKEIFPKMTDKEKALHKENHYVVKKKFNQCMAGTPQISLSFLEAFDEWEIELREVAEEHNLLMPNEDNEQFDEDYED